MEQQEHPYGKGVLEIDNEAVHYERTKNHSCLNLRRIKSKGSEKSTIYRVSKPTVKLKKSN